MVFVFQVFKQTDLAVALVFKGLCICFVLIGFVIRSCVG